MPAYVAPVVAVIFITFLLVTISWVCTHGDHQNAEGSSGTGWWADMKYMWSDGSELPRALQDSPSSELNDDMTLSEDGLKIPFMRIGTGECLAGAKLRVRGRSKRDVMHDECRRSCIGGCIGYSYAPCERVCAIHGDPRLLTSASELQGWSTQSGGGKIFESSGKCGSACFARMEPCEAGTVESGGVRVNHSALAFDATVYTQCTFPFIGILELRCGLNGVEVLGGRCKQPCPPGSVIDRYFEVQYPGILHGYSESAACPGRASGAIVMSCTDGQALWTNGICGMNCDAGSAPAGKGQINFGPSLHQVPFTKKCPCNREECYSGEVLFECIDSYVRTVSGTCYKHCKAGYLNYTRGGKNIGWVYHGDLAHMEEALSECHPSSKLAGQLTLICIDGEVFINRTEGHGKCEYHCNAGYIGEGIKAIQHRKYLHGEEDTLVCDEPRSTEDPFVLCNDTDYADTWDPTATEGNCTASKFTGNVEIKCTDGTLNIVSGGCWKHCEPGQVFSNGWESIGGAIINHNGSRYGEHLYVPCPDKTHSGILHLYCNDGAMDTLEGYCGLDCQYGEWVPVGVSNNEIKLEYFKVRHDTAQNITCKQPYTGNITVNCNDGEAWMTGYCGRMCHEGFRRSNGAIVYYPDMNHTDVLDIQCVTQYPGGPLTFSGTLEIRCFRGEVLYEGACYPDCPDGKVFSQGFRIDHPFLKSNEIMPLPCGINVWDHGKYGYVDVGCIRGDATITGDRTCGAPCPQATLNTRYTAFSNVDVPEIGHQATLEMECPPILSGKLAFSCFDGDRNLVGENSGCGERCLAKNIIGYGYSFVTPKLDHNNNFSQPCNQPYSGTVDLSCYQGMLTIINNCRGGCFAGVAEINGGTETADTKAEIKRRTAMIAHPNMEDSVRFRTTCPSGFSGKIELMCWNGTALVIQGGCDANCPSGQWEDKGVSVTHYEMFHNDSLFTGCPSGWYGNVTLQCLRGQVALTAGGCFENCQAADKYIRVGVVVSHGYGGHGEMFPAMRCPAGYAGTLRLQCWDGRVTLLEGSCQAHCQSGQTTDGAEYGVLEHNTTASLLCPELGEVVVKCFDGSVRKVGGFCMVNCEAGSLTDANGTVVKYPTLPHGGSISGMCDGFAVGSRTVNCSDGIAQLVHGTGERCFKHCRAGSVNASGVEVSTTSDLNHGHQQWADCPAGELGQLRLRCFDSELHYSGGACGESNCRAGTVPSGSAVLSHPDLNNGMEEGPYACPAGYKGNTTFICDNGTTRLGEVSLFSTLPRYQADRAANSSNKSGNSTFVLSTQSSERSQNELGYDPYSSLIVLCECCMEPVSPPGTEPVPARDQRAYLYWGGAIIFLGFIGAVLVGIRIVIILKRRARKDFPIPEKLKPNKKSCCRFRKKLSTVTPEDDVTLDKIKRLPPDQAIHIFTGTMGVAVNTSGVCVEVTLDGPAYTKGIETGDRILTVGTEPFTKETLERATKGVDAYEVLVKKGKSKFRPLYNGDWEKWT